MTSPNARVAADECWHLVYTVTRLANAEDRQTTLDDLGSALYTLALPEDFLLRVNIAVGFALEAITYKATLLNLHVYLFCPTEANQPHAHGWGFFLIEKSGRKESSTLSVPEALIEIYLYQEQ